MRKFFQVFYIALMLLFIYAPICTLVLYSFVDTPVVSIEQAFKIGFSFELYKKLFADSALMTIVWDTLILAVVAAVIATILGTLGAIGIYYSKGKLGKSVSAASRIPVINAEIVTAVALVYSAPIKPTKRPSSLRTARNKAALALCSSKN